MKKIGIMISIIILVEALIAVPSGVQILNELDKQQQLSSDFTARITFVQTRPVQGKRKYEMMYYRRDKDDSFLLLMLSPDIEKGNGYLKSGDNFWMYRRNTRTFQHISRDESIGGTDMKGGDLEQRKMSELYQVTKKDGKEVVSKEMLGKIPVYKIKIEAIVDDVTYPIQVLWVRTDNYLLLKGENYSRSGTLMQTQLFPKYTKVKGRYVPIMGYTKDEFEIGNKTIFQITDISLNPINSSVFTKGYLENLSQ